MLAMTCTYYPPNFFWKGQLCAWQLLSHPSAECLVLEAFPSSLWHMSSFCFRFACKER